MRTRAQRPGRQQIEASLVRSPDLREVSLLFPQRDEFGSSFALRLFFMARHQTASRLLRIHDTDHGGGSSFERDDDSRVDDGSTDYMEVARSLGGLSNVGT